MDTSEELALVKQAQAGDKESLGLLWDVINPKLYGYLLNTLHDKRLADDILQETWYKAIKAIDQFKPKGVRFSAWLFAIARNSCREYWRKEIPKQTIKLEEVELGGNYDGIEVINNNLEIEKALLSVNEKDREIIRLRYIAELSFKEIATVLEISIVSARVKTHRAIKRIRVKYNN